MLQTEASHKARETVDQERSKDLPTLPPVPSSKNTAHVGERNEARTDMQCAQQLNAALALALKSAPKQCWYALDTAGRQPTHHLLENPIRYSCRLGTTMVAELERRLAALDVPKASFNFGP